MGSASSINTALGSLPIPVGTDNGTANGFVGKVSPVLLRDIEQLPMEERLQGFVFLF